MTSSGGLFHLTVGWIPTVTAMGYINFYAQVRAVNLGLSLEQRIHVWLVEGQNQGRPRSACREAQPISFVVALFEERRPVSSARWGVGRSCPSVQRRELARETDADLRAEHFVAVPRVS